MTDSKIKVICHDERNIVYGVFKSITDIGCEIISGVKSSHSIFPQKTKVTLNLLDEETGQSINIRARLTAVQRVNGQWVYRIRWSQCPSFLYKESKLVA